MQKHQLIKWVSNIIKTKVMKSEEAVVYELEAKIGQFKGMNYQSKKYLESIKGFEQLDKLDKKYQFESKINYQQYCNALEYMKSKSNPIILQRLDFSLNKQQRSSFQIQNDQISAVLIEKIKSLSQHIDMVNDSTHFRISLNQEKSFSKSLKDILAQLPSRKQHANFIRLKETMIVSEDNLEFALSRVLPISKSEPLFNTIIQKVMESRCYNIKDTVSKLFQDAIFKDYEFEIEVCQNLKLEDEQIENLAIELLNKIDYFWGVFNTQQDNEEKIEKKVKTNDNE